MLQFKNIIILACVYLMLNNLIRVFTMLNVERIYAGALRSVYITELRNLSSKSKRIVNCIIKLSFYLYQQTTIEMK